MTQRSDTERLEWLEKQPKATSIFEGKAKLQFYAPYIGPWDTIREAIDAAMNAEPP